MTILWLVLALKGDTQSPKQRHSFSFFQVQQSLFFSQPFCLLNTVIHLWLKPYFWLLWFIYLTGEILLYNKIWMRKLMGQTTKTHMKGRKPVASNQARYATKPLPSMQKIWHQCRFLDKHHLHIRNPWPLRPNTITFWPAAGYRWPPAAMHNAASPEGIQCDTRPKITSNFNCKRHLTLQKKSPSWLHQFSNSLTLSFQQEQKDCKILHQEKV